MILLQDVFPQMQTGSQGNRRAKNHGQFKEFIINEFCTIYFLRFIMYDIRRNIVQESG